MNKVGIVGYGYLGEAIDHCFSEAGWQVVRVGRTVSEGIEEADVTSLESLYALKARVGELSHVIHCASSGRGGPEAYRNVFERGCGHLLEVFDSAHLMFTSSTSVYAQTEGETVDETSETSPERETGEILLASERRALASDATVLRLSGIYGEGRSFILKKWLRRELKVEEDGRRILNQIHRSDAAKAFLCVAEKGLKGELFNVSETKPKSQLETIQWLADHDQRPLPESEPRDPNRKRGWTHKRVSNQKLLAQGWCPHYTTFTDAVDDIIATIDYSS